MPSTPDTATPAVATLAPGRTLREQRAEAGAQLDRLAGAGAALERCSRLALRAGADDVRLPPEVAAELGAELRRLAGAVRVALGVANPFTCPGGLRDLLAALEAP